MKIVAISDTHLTLKADLPDADVLIHCGDYGEFGTPEELTAFSDWFKAQPYKYKIFVPGNHDGIFQSDPDWALAQMTGIEVLIDRSIEIEGHKFYGSPWTPRFGDWWFMYDETPSNNPFASAPQADVVCTHGPPHGVLDTNSFGKNCGSVHLANYLHANPPRLHVFGHIHEAHGIDVSRWGGCVSANVARARNWGKAPFVFEI